MMMMQQQQEAARRHQEEMEMQQERQALLRDGQDDEDDQQQEDDMDMGRPQRLHDFNDGGQEGAIVQEAKKLMADDDDAGAPPQAEDNGGPKIKMGRIGKKKKKGGAATKTAGESYTKKIGGGADPIADVRPSGGGGFNENDIEFMKKAIQILCQSTNPLGKSIDFVTDDVDSMSKEYEHWRKEAISCTQALEEQQKVTEEVVQPL